MLFDPAEAFPVREKLTLRASRDYLPLMHLPRAQTGLQAQGAHRTHQSHFAR